MLFEKHLQISQTFHTFATVFIIATIRFMPKRIYKSMPEGYSVCQHDDCEMASVCLHQMAYPKMMESDTILYLLNPKQCSKNSECKFYRNCEPVTYAKGFKNFQEKMYPGQYREFMEILKAEFGRNAYYERRSGLSALPPKEQEIVLNALKQVGVTEEMAFDSYEKRINWYD